MRNTATALALLLAAAALAGCSGSPQDPPGAPGSPAAGKDCPCDAASLPLPTWALRDSWTYEAAGSPITYVVTGEAGGDWIMETDSPERAFQDLRDDISRLGPQRKSDLAGSQGSDRVEFFQWPLTDNKTWTTPWDHQQLTITAHIAEGKAHLQATDANGSVLYRYVYDPEAGWFRSLSHYAPDGTELIGFKLASSGHNWTGQVARWDVVDVGSASGSLANGANSAVNFDVPLSATDVWTHAKLSCTSGLLTAGVAPMPVVTTFTGLDARGGGVGGDPCPLDDEFIGSVGAPKALPTGGPTEPWGWSALGPPGGVGDYSIEVLVRTLTLVAVP